MAKVKTVLEAERAENGASSRHGKQKQDDQNTKKEKIKREGAKIIRHGDMAARNLRSKLMSDLRIEQDRR